MPLEALGYSVLEKFLANNCFEKGGITKDEVLLNRAFEAGKNLVKSI
ncbi:MAG: hypothetical protein QCH31_03890 [Methanolobus sp.]|nr:hypothetical protein [Methanolobus sp.]